MSKPCAGVPVHHAGRYRRNTLVEILQAEHPELGLGGDASASSSGLHVLHRLDRQVSGVLYWPRTPSAAAALGEALRDGCMRKRYLSRVRGFFLQPGHAIAVTAPIRVLSASGRTVTDCHEEGKHATTILRCIGHDLSSCTSLVLCEPITWAEPSIALAFSPRVGHPIQDDPLYDTSHAATKGTTPPSSLLQRAKRPRTGHNEQAGRGRGRGGGGGGGGGSLWLHAWSYSVCEGGARPFPTIEAPPPSWCDPFRVELPPPCRSSMRSATLYPSRSEIGQRLLYEVSVRRIESDGTGILAVLCFTGTIRICVVWPRLRWYYAHAVTPTTRGAAGAAAAAGC